MIKLFSATLITFYLAAVSFYAQAGGVALGSTRVIYMAGDKQASLPIMNTNTKDVFLIQNWVSTDKGVKSPDFIVTPPLFVIKPQKENILRIIYTGPDLPDDRESIFYLNSKAIPAASKETQSGNTLQIATQSVIKIFMRPKNLPSPSITAPESLKCHLSGGVINFNNPTPYYISLVEFYSGSKKLPNTMIAPKSSVQVTVPLNAMGNVSFKTVNDFGAITSKLACAN